MDSRKERLTGLCTYLQEHKDAAIILPMGDPHGSEYIGESDRWIFYLTGFSGSAGVLVVHAGGDAYLITDGRYHIQAEQELADSGVVLVKMGAAQAPDMRSALVLALTGGAASAAEDRQQGKDREGAPPVDLLQDGWHIALPGSLVSAHTYQRYEQLILSLTTDGDSSAEVPGAAVLTDIDLHDLAAAIWPDRPARRSSAAWLLPESISGTSLEERFSILRRKMGAKGIDCYVVTALDAIAWLFDLRGDDIAYTPVLYAWLILENERGKLYLQAETAKTLQQAFIDRLRALGVSVCDYADFEADLARVNGTVAIDPSAVNHHIASALDPSADIIHVQNDQLIPQSLKNEIQMAMIHKAHSLDGIALTKLIYRLKKGEFTGKSEWDVACALEELRRVIDTYIEPSFATIAAYGSNAAIVHYTPSEEHHAFLEAHGFLLLDCGGQYRQGTTDVTRTIALGPLSDDEKAYYTAVLRGHLRLANAVIDTKTPTRKLDAIARGPLWELGADYLHGTGHGVGHVLSVHEGPVRILRAKKEDYYPDDAAGGVMNEGSRLAKATLEPDDHPLKLGQVVSNEPGYYREGAFGIRIENLIYRTRNLQLRPYLKTLTLAPYEPEAILADQLNEDERRWLNRYHERVYELLSPHLSEEERAWLQSQTQPV